MNLYKRNSLKTVILIFCLLSFKSTFAYQVTYSISMLAPSKHFFNVAINISGIKSNTINIQMPAWQPGVCNIADFARYITDFNAYNLNHKKLHSHKTDKQTWKIETKNNSTIIISYKVYADPAPGTTSQLTTNLGFINGTSLFMYIVNGKNSQSNLVVNLPVGWQILSAAGTPGQNKFTFSNYDLLADHSIQLGKFFTSAYKIHKTTYYLSVAGDYNKKFIPNLLNKTQLIERTATSMLPSIDAQQYTNFFQFMPSSEGSDGLEHLDNFFIFDNQILSDHNTVANYPLAWVIAHEFVHRWNVKRLRPVNLGPFDYTHEVYTPLLWFVEGATSYLGDLILLRSGIWSTQNFYDHMSKQITLLNNTKGRFVRSAEQSSFDIWLRNKEGGTFWNSVWVDPHIKGEIICWMMDLEIRKQTHNTKNFIDFFNLLYNRMYVQAKPDSYYLKGRGYTTHDILQALEDTTHTNWDNFYKKNISSPGEIDYQHYLIYKNISWRASIK